MFEVAVLGAVQARLHGHVVPLKGAKQRALLAVLALADGRAVPVGTLVGSLWDSPPRDPSHALQTHISRLRAALPVTVSWEYGGYRLAADDVDVDAILFEQRCAHARELLVGGDAAGAVDTFRGALGLWRGEALAGIAKTAVLRPDATRLESLRVDAESDLIDARLRLGEAAEVIAGLRLAVDRDRLNERRWGQLMTALHQCGRRGEALQAYQRVRVAFEEELGSDPPSWLDDLHVEILRAEAGAGAGGVRADDADDAGAGGVRADVDVDADDAHDAAPALTRSGGSATARTPATLTGRRQELAALANAWRQGADSLQVVSITGEPGIGKTTLAREFIRTLAERSIRSFIGRCDESVQEPYRPIREWLRADLTGMGIDGVREYLGVHAADLIAMLPDRFPEYPAGADRVGDAAGSTGALRSERALGAGSAARSERAGAGVDSGAGAGVGAGGGAGGGVSTGPDWRSPGPADLREGGAFSAVAAWLAAVTAAQPIVFLLDDLQWADPATGSLLRYLILRPAGIRALVIVTCRGRDECSDIADLLPLLVRQSETVTHIPLGPLPGDDGDTLLRSEVHNAGGDDALADAMSGHVADISGGNPLFIIELARQAAMTPPAERDALLTRPLPSGIVDVIERRLALLPEQVVGVLKMASVMGRRFDPHVLLEASDYPMSDLDELLTTASRAGLVATDGVGRSSYVFRHDVVRTSLYESVTPVRRGAMHVAIGEAITKLYGPGSPLHIQALAYHFSAAASSGIAHMSDRAVQHLILAGDAAMRERAPGSALTHYRAAANLVPHELDSETYCDVLTSIGMAEVQLGDSRYRETLLRAARIAHDLGDSARLTAATVANSRGWYSSTSHVDVERIALIEIALSQCTDERSLALLQASWALENVRDPERRHEVLRRSQFGLETAEAIGDPAVIGQTLSQRYAVMYATFCDPVACVELSKRFYSFAHTRNNDKMQLQSAIGLAQASLTTGDWELAERGLARAVELAALLSDSARSWMLDCWQATILAARGDLAGAHQQARAAFDTGSRAAQPDAETWYAGQLFTFGLMADQLDGVLDRIGEEVASHALTIPSWRAAYALGLAKVGSRDKATGIITELTAGGRVGLPVDMLWLPGMAYLAEAVMIAERSDVAPMLYEALAAHAGLIAHNGTIDAGPVDLHLGMLALASGRADAASTHLAAAVAQCMRLQLPVWRAKAEQYVAAARA